MMRIDREDRSLLATWWFTVDRVLLTAVFALMVVGVVVSLAASPAVAINKDLDAFYFVKRHMLFLGGGVLIMLALSTFSARMIRRSALILFLAALVMMVYVLAAGEEINGAHRWVRLAGISFQPSEVAKPAFVVLSAWAFAEHERRRDMPALPLALIIYLLFLGLLILQPDLGQSLLISLVWGALFVLAGLPLAWAAALGGLAVAGLGVAYLVLPYARDRIDLFFLPTAGDQSQLGRAYSSFREGGFFGRGPGEGTIKTVLPDAHTDFIFAVIAEEYGVIACLALLTLIMFITFRALVRSIAIEDLAARYAIAGLALLIGLQSLVHMGVNVGLLPPTGMTLPWISAGGSSALATAVTFGMILALSRRSRAMSSPELPPVEVGAMNFGSGQIEARSR